MPSQGVLRLARVLVLLLSFSAICQGALCVSASAALCRGGNGRLPRYSLLPLGFLLLALGLFWSTLHAAVARGGLRSALRRRRRLAARPDRCLPSYAASTDPEKQNLPLPAASARSDRAGPGLPPPPYAEGSVGPVGERRGQEQPPPYEPQPAAPARPNAC